MPPRLSTPLVVILAGCLISAIGFGIRSVLGLFLEPMTGAYGWSRETYGLALAIQNLFWGLMLPLAGALADRFGPVWVIAAGAVMYCLGLIGMSFATAPFALHLTAGVLTGTGIAFSSFSLALAVMAREVGPEKRSMVLGIGTAAGSFGQVVFSPMNQAFIDAFGWQAALMMIAYATLVMIPLAMLLPNRPNRADEVAEQTVKQAFSEAFQQRSYWLLTCGFFVCGFHLAFITVHFPAYVRDLGLSAQVGAWSLALIGFCNIAGSFLSGLAGQWFSKKWSLCFIYTARAVAVTGLLLLPKTEITIYIFAALMGILWLSTVPLTTGIIAQVFGLKYLAALYGVVFLGHQLGSFSGVWLGGYLYDATGSYDGMWVCAIVLGLVASALHAPINEQPLVRRASAAAVLK